MAMVSVLRAAGDTDPGLQREVNEDRFHFDLARGCSWSSTASADRRREARLPTRREHAQVASRTRDRPPVDRLREAITIANNEIHRLARLRPEWNGMACVLTVVVLDEARAVVGHVGDTRLYKIRHDRIDKVTRDHSPVGEREDAHELSELEAMHHPRRNEVYRDVGSERHEASDPDFVEVKEIPFEPDAALLLCSDGLTDLVESETIAQIVWRWAGQPQQVVRALIDAANDAGGKDNITVVYVEGEQFAPPAGAAASVEITRRLSTGQSASSARESAASDDVEEPTSKRRQAVRWMLLVLLTIVIVLAVDRSDPLAPALGRARSARSGVQHRNDRGAADRFDSGGTAECRRRNHGDRRARRVSRNDDAQELHPRRQPSSARRAHQAAGQRIGCRCRNPGA